MKISQLIEEDTNSITGYRLKVKPCLSTNGYDMVSYKKKRYTLSRVLYCWYNGLELPDLDGKVIDHINRNTRDNRKENLRLVSPKLNARNRKKPATNTSGTCGVYYRDNKDYPKWIAIWRDDKGKQRSKSFGVGKYGDKAECLAKAWRKAQLDSTYTPNHGE